jgi:hypothetical protein
MVQCPPLALSGHGLVHRTCLLLGVKRTSRSAFRKAPAATFRIGLGEQISALGSDSTAGTLNVTELS